MKRIHELHDLFFRATPRGIRFVFAACSTLIVLMGSHAALAACASPVGAEGAMVYNDTYKLVQFCNGTSWYSMAGAPNYWTANGADIYRSSGSVGIGTSTPNANAILDVSSTTKAFLPPRMTTTQRDAIASPAVGMTVFNTSTGGLDTYGPIQTGGSWVNGWLPGNGALRGLGRGSSGDYNTIISNAYPESPGGVWWMDGPGSTNGPTGTNSGVLLHLDPLYNTAGSRNKYALQIATNGSNSGPLYYRAQTNGTWGAWASGGASATANVGYVQIAGASNTLTDSGTTATQQFFWDNTNKRLGLGTAAPSARAEVYGAGQLVANLTDAGARNNMLAINAHGVTAGDGGAITFGNLQSVTANSIGFAAIKGMLVNGATNTTGDLSISTRNAPTDTALTERIRILGTGNVGIGTSTPVGKLDVIMASTEYGGVSVVGENYSGADTATRLRVQDTTGNVAWFLSANNNGTFALHQGGVGDRLTIDTSGNLAVANNVTAVAFLYASDRRLKDDINPLANALDNITKLEPVSFVYKNDAKKDQHLGLIAQDVKEVFPQVVKVDADGMMAVDYPGLIGPMIGAIKELKAENEALSKRLEKLEAAAAR